MTTPSSGALDVKEIRDRTEKATPGPWIRRGVRHKIGPEEFLVVGPDGKNEVAFLSVGSQRGYKFQPDALRDGDFIAHARTDIPALLKELDRLTTELERAREALAEERAACLAIATEHSSPPFGHSDPEYRRAWHAGERSAATEIAEEIQNRSILSP